MKKYLILFFIILACSRTENTTSIIDKIPDNPLVVLNVNNYKEINYKQLNLLEKSINLKFENIDLLEPQGELIYSFHKTGKKDLNSVVIQQDFDYKINDSLVCDTLSYNGQNIYLFKDDFYLSKIDSYIFFSKEKLLIENIIRDATFSKNEEYLNFKKTHSFKTKNISLNISEKYGELNFNSKKEDISKYSKWIQYELDAGNDNINILGVFEREDNKQINLLLDIKKSKSNIIKLVPNNFSEFIRLSFQYETLENNFNNQQIKVSANDKKLNSFFKDVNELGLISVNDESLLVLNFNEGNLNESFNDKKLISKYRGQSIFDASNINLSSFNILEFDLLANYSFFTVINESVIFANDISTIQNMLLNYNNKSLIINNPNFLNFLKSIPEKTTFFEILNLNDSNENVKYPYWFTNYELKGENNFKSIFTTTNFDIKTQKKLKLIFSRKIDTEIIFNPKFIYNYKSGEKNIILQDNNYNLIVLDMNGKDIMKKKLNSKIISDIFQVDLYKNNRLQYAFLTDNEFLILDINGKLVKKISQKKSSSEKYLSVFDYDNNRNYRFLIQDGMSLKMLDSKFDLVKGFKRNKLKSEIKFPVKHLRILNKDYLLLVSKNNKPLILDRRGNIRIKIPNNLTTSSNHLFENDGGMITINDLNQLIRIELNGKISSKQLVDEKNMIYANKNNLIILSNGNILINNTDFKIPFGKFDDLNIESSKNNTYFHFRDIDEKKSYLFNSNGKVSGFPIYSTSNFEFSFDKGQDLITFKGDDDEILLYSLN